MYPKKWVPTTFLQVADESCASDISLWKPCGDEPIQCPAALRASLAWLGVETGKMKRNPQSSLCYTSRGLKLGGAWLGELERSQEISKPNLSHMLEDTAA